MMKSMGMVYQMKAGSPFVLREIDPLFYACCYLNSNQMFLMEKEKFYHAMNKGTIAEFKSIVNL
ncbi:hypothetical protein [Tepidibacillus marianensis]|uniref:hypothetical protein n=1 Tax=Tepidibacillus marianensis TaxID=3131995 RepID=UPI0030D3DE1B